MYFNNILAVDPSILCLDAWAILNQRSLSYRAYSGSPVNVDLTFRMPFDTQLPTHLLGSKPFPGMQIYTTSLVLEMSRQSLASINMPYFLPSNNVINDEHVVSFGLKADWGFAPIAQLS